MQITEAHNYCRRIANQHYENFPVASMLIPHKYRKAIYAIYAFARKADDFADQNEDLQLARKKLDEWRDHLRQTEKSSPPDLPEFIALADIIDHFSISTLYLHDLLDAFFQDTAINRYEDWTTLLLYCQKSANPVGRLLLQLFEMHTVKLVEISDALCSGLQLINFWQDLSVDIPRRRFYIPLEEWKLFGDMELNGKNLISFKYKQALLEKLVAKTWEIYKPGENLHHHLPGRIGIEIGLTYGGGAVMLKKVEKAGERVFTHRPKLTSSDMLSMTIKMILKKL